ncbi:MAG: glycosyltransferase family 2 protein [bacterium]|nr:glycosyltransferase family 2 protein [bacterium]MDZ4299363.1 glycosyltransferase family 2 protein [Candidatus Sungbacteria bacterium]
MKISFVIPAHNEEGYLAACIVSIQKALAAGTYDAEIIVVNNASTDRTHEIAASFVGVGVIDEPQKGITYARSAGYRAATGDLIANIDADTRLPPEWLDRVMKEFGRDKNKKLVALSGPFLYYDLPLLSRVFVKFFYGLGYATYFVNHFILGVGAMLQGGNFVVRRSALEQIGGYDTSIEFYGEDTDIARRLAKIGRVKWTFGLPVYTSGRRLKGEGVIATGARYALNYFWTTFFGRPFTLKHRDVRERSTFSASVVASPKEKKRGV